MNRKAAFFLAYCFIVIGVLFYVELALPIAYVYKIGLKITLFLLPILWLGSSFFAAADAKRTRLALCLGVGSLMLILAAYWVLQDFIDLQQIKTLLAERQGITRQTYVLVAIYAILGNSILEEVFFRGIIVQHLKYRPWVISSALFSFYHLTIFISWFSWWILLIALVSLFVGGLLFCWLNGERRSIWNSWLMHVFADVAIFGIGFIIYF